MTITTAFKVSHVNRFFVNSVGNEITTISTNCDRENLVFSKVDTQEMKVLYILFNYYYYFHY